MECFDSLADCCAAFWCSPCYSYIASDAAQQPFLVSALNCLCYPLGLCYLRPAVRNELGIEV